MLEKQWKYKVNRKYLVKIHRFILVTKLRGFNYFQCYLGEEKAQRVKAHVFCHTTSFGRVEISDQKLMESLLWEESSCLYVMMVISLRS